MNPQSEWTKRMDKVNRYPFSYSCRSLTIIDTPTFILFRTHPEKPQNRESIQCDPFRKIPQEIRERNQEVSLVVNSANFASANALPAQCGEKLHRALCVREKIPQQTKRAAPTQAAFLVEIHCEQELD